MLHGFKFSKLVFLSTLVFAYSMPVIFIFFNTKDQYPRCTKSNW